METFLVMSFWYPCVATEYKESLPTLIQKKCPLFDTFCSVRAEALIYKVKLFCTVSGMALNAQNYAGVMLCVWIPFLFYENTFPCLCLCNLGKALHIFMRKQHSCKYGTAAVKKMCVFKQQSQKQCTGIQPYITDTGVCWE